MKRILAIFLVAIMCVSLTACGGKKKKAFEASKAAYDNINTAYEISEQFSEDIYEAWRLGIYDKDKLIENGIKYLDAELHLSESELEQGLIYSYAEGLGKDVSELSETEKSNLINYQSVVFTTAKSEMFSFCVHMVRGAYTVNGKIEEIQAALDQAKAQMKELSDKFSDYEHYPSLKGFYTTTSALFDFCQNPEGSFEQVIQTINNYRNEARDYMNDLKYIFEG